MADSGFFRDVKMVKDAGFDFIRGSHYPHAPAFAAACDELGILFWSENCFWGTGGFRSPWAAMRHHHAADEPGFKASVKASLRDMIRIHRNHPSIVVWSMCNEVFFSDRSAVPKARDFLRELVAYSHDLRSNASGRNRRLPARRHRQTGRRGRLQRRRRAALHESGDSQRDHRIRLDNHGPAGQVRARLGRLAGHAWSESKRGRFLAAALCSGEVLWCAFDHGSLAGRRFGSMGMVDYFRLPKRNGIGTATRTCTFLRRPGRRVALPPP